MTHCTLKTESKYKNRPSPPYAANECCWHVKYGNDDSTYKSVPNKNGICRWVKIK